MQPQTPIPQGPLPTGYEFLTNPGTPPKSNLGPSSTVMRALLVGGVLLIVLVLFVFIKGLLSGGGNQAQLLSVAQDQQAIIHLVMAAPEEKSLSLPNLNFAYTARTSVVSQQAELTTYARKNKVKFNAKTLSLKVSAATDTKLAAASSADNYNPVFKSIMQNQLNTYQRDLKAAYAKTTGPNGKKLLSEDYAAASLLLQQLAAN